MNKLQENYIAPKVLRLNNGLTGMGACSTGSTAETGGCLTGVGAEGSTPDEGCSGGLSVGGAVGTCDGNGTSADGDCIDGIGVGGTCADGVGF